MKDPAFRRPSWRACSRNSIAYAAATAGAWAPGSGLPSVAVSSKRSAGPSWRETGATGAEPSSRSTSLRVACWRFRAKTRRVRHERNLPPPLQPRGGARVPMSAAAGTPVLVVDDEPAILRLLRTSLDAQGYRTIDADCGAKALEQLR